MNVPCTARVSQQVDTEKNKNKKKPALPYRLSVREFIFGESVPWLPCAPREACLLVQASPAWEVQIEPTLQNTSSKWLTLDIQEISVDSFNQKRVDVITVIF